MKSTAIIIPTRLKAKRFPNKPLAKIKNIPMIVHVVNRAKEASIGQVIVATPDQEIIDIVKKNGGQAILTKNEHPSGSDRVYEAYLKMLENKVDCKIKKKGSNQNILSPGQMFKHYSPSKKLIINSIKPTKNCSFLGFSNIMPDEKFDGIALNLSNSGDLNEAASNLFKMLRFLDKTDTQEIVVAPIPNKDIGFAINDKLKRASS